MKRLYCLPLSLVFFLFFIVCNNKPKLTDVDPAFSVYIDAYTSGTISKTNTVRIQLAADANVTHALNETISEELFEFSPSVKGKAYWIDARTIEFKPDEALKPDMLYEISFNLVKVINVPLRFNTFRFNVQTVKPSFDILDNGLKSTGKTTMTLTGTINTADVESSANIEKLLQATLNNDKLKILWQHNEANKIHDFVINNIEKSNAAKTLTLQWNGKPFNMDIEGAKTFKVPAVGDFKVLSVKAVQGDAQYALVQFSDALEASQTLDGLITISNQESASFFTNGSEVKVYTNKPLDGDFTVNINNGVLSSDGRKTDKTFTSNIYFETGYPAVKIVGRGNILPSSSSRLLLPFDATNLKAVDVAIIKIYENNIAQFLQQNDLNGDNNLRNVAKPVVKATVRLDNDNTLDLHKKNRFSLDIDKYIQAEPGALYHVFIGFKPEYSLYNCHGDTTKENKDDDEDYYYRYASDEDQVDEDAEFWQRYNDYYPYGYNWNLRDNPCSKSFYNKERFTERNILASNIGLTAKRSNNNALLVAVSNLIDTKPMSVELEVLDYQQQIIAKTTSDNNGIALIDLKRKPFLLIAKRDNEKSYLKLDDGSSLPLSRFDVDGVAVNNGIKGFIFGERGVWRPGDSLFLNCIIEDKDNKLPADHPIEMNLISPRGQLYKKIVQQNAEDGFNVFRTATDAEAPTGNWTCKVKIGGASFEKMLKIETVMPNRLKIDLNFNGLTALGEDANTNGTLTAKWLFGAPAQNLKARVDAQLYKRTTSFAGFKDYVFDDPTASFSSQSKTIFDGTLNDEGVAVVNPTFGNVEHAPGQLLANLTTKVFEPGGNFSIDNFSMPYNPYTSYIGIHKPPVDKTWGFLLAGQQHKFDIANVDAKGKLLSVNTQVEIELYRVQWRWWWDDTGDDFTNFTQNNYNKLIKKDTVDLVSGKGFYNIFMNEDSWGRYLLLVKDKRSGHIAGTDFYIDDYGWQSRSGNNDVSAAAMLSFTASKTSYNVGEDVQLTIPSSKGGRALVSIETGSRVLNTYWIETQQGQTKYSFKATKDMSPNIYVTVSLIQPHAQTVNDLPIRMYGSIPITVEDKNTVLKPVIKMPDVIKPEQNNTITVSEANGKSMTYVIALVDEGLLDLTHFKTPDPHEAFYAKEALGVKSWDIYDYVIGAYGSELQRILTIGGDAEAEIASKTRRANRFSPIVKFLGPFKSNGSADSHNFILPPYMGSVRAMVIAKADGAYGMTEKNVTVKKPLMMLATLPRVLAPLEEFKIPVTIFATEKNIKNVSLSLQSNPFIASGGTQNVSFSKTGEQLVYFNATVKANTGIGKIKIVASSGKEQTMYETEIDIRNPNSYTTQTTTAILQPGKSWSSQVSMIGESSTSKATLEISSLPSLNLQARLNYLIQYPHGCIEQTTSAVFPQLYLSQLLDLSEPRKANIDNNIRAAIQKLQNFQTTDGGFSYWPGENMSDEWGSNYAGHFLLAASTKSYNVSSSVMQLWKQYERSKALAWNVTTAPWYGTDLSQAYRLYLLALAKSPELGAMNRLKEFKFLSPEAKWRLAAAYQLIGQQQVALNMISRLPTSFPKRPNPGISFGSDLRDQAMVLETLTIMNRKAEAAQLVIKVAEQLAQDNWYSTQTTAYALLAIAEFSGINTSGNKINAAVIINGKSNNINSNNTLSQTAMTWQNAKSATQVTNKGSNVLYARVINEGQPLNTQIIPAHNDANVLQVTVSYITTSGNAIDITNIKQGTDFVAKVVIKNPGNHGDYTNMALTQIFPSGWEILNTRLFNSEGAFTSSPSDYMDIRDDRVYHYFDLKAYETRIYYVQLNAAYVGKYVWPGVNCEAMYDHTISGGVTGKWVNVVQ